MTSSESGPPRVALVTGGTGGLGEAVTRIFLERGCGVLVPYRRATEAERLRTSAASWGTAATGASAGAAASQRLLLLPADVTDTTQMEQVAQKAVATFGHLDYLVNLVGGWSGGPPVWETTAEAWDQMMVLNLRTAFASCRAVVPQMLAQRYGRIVNVSSRSAVQPAPGVAAYAVSKAGVITLTETLALEVREHGDITVNCILPSVIDTPANRQSMPNADHTRWVRPEQLAAIIAWLTSDEAAPISGASFPAYGRA